MRITTQTFSSLALSIACISLPGCWAAAILDKVEEPTEQARYMPIKDNMVVVVEDYQNPASIAVVAEHIDRLIGEELIAHKAAPIINPDRLTVLRTDKPAEYRKLEIPAIGRAVGAQQVLYADVTHFTVETAYGVETFKGHAEARVRIVDTLTGKTRWPNDAPSSGYTVTVDVPYVAEATTNNVTESTVREALADKLAERIARLFYNATILHPDAPPTYPETDAH